MNFKVFFNKYRLLLYFLLCEFLLIGVIVCELDDLQPLKFIIRFIYCYFCCFFYSMI